MCNARVPGRAANMTVRPRISRAGISCARPESSGSGVCRSRWRRGPAPGRGSRRPPGCRLPHRRCRRLRVTQRQTPGARTEAIAALGLVNGACLPDNRPHLLEIGPCTSSVRTVAIRSRWSKLTPREEIDCPSCGSSFCLETESTTGWVRERREARQVRVARHRRPGGFRHRLQGPRPGAGPHRGHQGAARRQPGRAAGTGPLPARGPQRRPAAAPVHRLRPRGRPERRRALPGQRLRPGRDAGRPAVGAAARLPRGGRADRRGRRRAALCPRTGRGPSRRQAVEHHDRRRRTSRMSWTSVWPSGMPARSP